MNTTPKSGYITQLCCASKYRGQNIRCTASNKFKLGSFPHGLWAIQRSTSAFPISLCTLVGWGVANVLGFGYTLWFILAVRPHPKRVLPFVCTDTRLGRCDLLLFDFRSYVTHSVEWGLLRTRGQQQILKCPQWHLLLQKGTSNKLEGKYWEEGWNIGLHINKNICIRKSRHLFSAHEPTEITFWRH